LERQLGDAAGAAGAAAAAAAAAAVAAIPVDGARLCPRVTTTEPVRTWPRGRDAGERLRARRTLPPPVRDNSRPPAPPPPRKEDAKEEEDDQRVPSPRPGTPALPARRRVRSGRRRGPVPAFGGNPKAWDHQRRTSERAPAATVGSGSLVSRSVDAMVDKESSK